MPHGRLGWMGIVLLSASLADGGQLSVRTAPTTGLPGFLTYTVSIETTAEEGLRGFSAEIVGPLNQVNPLGLATIFTDNNALFSFVGADSAQDSQFLFRSPDVLSIGVRESASLLSASIAGLQLLDLSRPTPIVQLVVEDPTEVTYEFAFDLGGGEPLHLSGPLDIRVTPQCRNPDEPPCPEPTTAVLLTMAALVVGSVTRRKQGG